MSSLLWIHLRINLKHVELFDVAKIRCMSKFGPTDLKGKNVSSQKWLIRQMKDPYVKMARQEDYRCRSAFKLLDIDSKYNIIKPGYIVVDCGAAPGSWTQVALDKIHDRLKLNDNVKPKNPTDKKGFVIGIDLTDMHPVEGAILIKNDFTKNETQETIKKILGDRKVDVMLSDMAPEITGMKKFDHENSIEQVNSVVRFSLQVLADGGTLLAKTFMGGDIIKLENNLKTVFKTVQWCKPHASRSDSSEIYILARGFCEVDQPPKDQK